VTRAAAQTFHALEDVQIVRGVIDLTGGVYTTISGSGFSGVRNGVGDATVNFDQPFAVAPMVVVSTTGAGVGGQRLACLVGPPNASAFRVLRTDQAFAALDGLVYFIAIGPAQ